MHASLLSWSRCGKVSPAQSCAMRRPTGTRPRPLDVELGPASGVEAGTGGPHRLFCWPTGARSLTSCHAPSCLRIETRWSGRCGRWRQRRFGRAQLVVRCLHSYTRYASCLNVDSYTIHYVVLTVSVCTSVHPTFTRRRLRVRLAPRGRPLLPVLTGSTDHRKATHGSGASWRRFWKESCAAQWTPTRCSPQMEAVKASSWYAVASQSPATP